MAHHGSPAAPPRAHPASVTLQAPRPEADRRGNDYVDNPLPPCRRLLHHHHHHHHHHQHLAPRPAPPPAPQNIISKQPRTNTTTRSTKSPQTNTNTNTTIISSSTPSPPLGGGNPIVLNTTSVTSPASCLSRRSIMCEECGRCRCFDCQQPARLPGCWLCGDQCLCSADAALDYASCLCCVKGVYYHCSDADSSESRFVVDPCGCDPDRRAARWGCLALLSVVLPCLWLYWPLRGCKGVVEKCYARCSKQGCRCRPRGNAPEKRLLDGSPDF